MHLDYLYIRIYLSTLIKLQFNTSIRIGMSAFLLYYFNIERLKTKQKKKKTDLLVLESLVEWSYNGAKRAAKISIAN